MDQNARRCAFEDLEQALPRAGETRKSRIGKGKTDRNFGRSPSTLGAFLDVPPRGRA